ncbi:MAG: HEAT repeat domain-containing protein, partial [Candidatus Omnitrophica bacterium]|nr:HEAT repeat domain-containing protein [Candidatus Omnitrophota bacterium]
MKNSRYSMFLKSIALTLSIAFFTGDMAQAAPELSFPSHNIVENPSFLKLPKTLGHIQDIYKAQKGAVTAPLLVHIQDAHTNLGAQENLAKILEELNGKYKIKTVFVEGGTRDDSLTRLRPLASKTIRQRVAKSYMVKGELNGAEYLNLASDIDMSIWGVEEKTLYNQNLRQYADVVKTREKTLSYIEEIQKRAESLKRRLYPKDVLTFDQTARAYERKEKDFAALYAEMSGMAQKTGVNLLGYPGFLSLKELKDKEAQIDFQKTKMDDPAVADYLSAASKVDMARLVRETEELKEELFSRALVAPDARHLHAISKHLGLLKKLFSLQASREDFDAYTANKKDASFTTIVILAFLNRKIVDLGNYGDVVKYLTLIDDNEKKVSDFYLTTERRDEAFVRKTLRKMAHDKLDRAALVTGGFHTPHLTRLLKEKGVSYVVVTPNLSNETNLKRYEEMLLGQLGSQNPIQRQYTAGSDSLGARLAAERLVTGDQGARLAIHQIARSLGRPSGEPSSQNAFIGGQPSPAARLAAGLPDEAQEILDGAKNEVRQSWTGNRLNFGRYPAFIRAFWNLLVIERSAREEYKKQPGITEADRAHTLAAYIQRIQSNVNAALAPLRSSPAARLATLNDLLGNDTSLIKAVQEVLEKNKYQINQEIIDNLTQLGPKALLIVFFFTSDERHLVNTAKILAQQGSEGIKALNQALLETQDESVRHNAALALANAGEAAKGAIPGLVKALLETQDENVHFWAVQALANAGEAAKNAVPGLAKALLETRNEDVRRYAAYALA